jgi:hypothetical protein
LVWVELPPLAFWRDPTIAVEVLLAGCWNSTSGMPLKVACSKPSVIVEGFWVGGWFWVEVWARLRPLITKDIVLSFQHC